MPPPIQDPQFAYEARTARHRLGITQAQAAARLGMSTRKLAAIEAGERTPRFYERVGILRVYETQKPSFPRSPLPGRS